MSKITYNICVLIVTYGDRWLLLKQILNRVISLEEVTSIIVVDNASAYSVDAHCRELQDHRIHVITNADNKGSAGGYKVGMECFINQTDADFLWLLDDDNLPHTEALQQLLSAWENNSNILKQDQQALFSLRLDRKQHLNIARGENANRYYRVPNSFMGFNVFQIPVNQYYKFRDKFRKNRPLKALAVMPYVPYGGLFLHRQLMQKIGYPDERFFLYADDSEYTYRITQAGGAIWLVSSSQIEDIDRSYGVTYVTKPWRSIFLDQWSFRSYYQVRNSIFFNSNTAVTNPLIYQLNKSLYLFGQRIISILTAKQKNYTKFLKAVHDGLAGNLGLVNTEEL
ncbi:Glycosyl transferase, family 2 [Arcticibacter svalbardensis MN12-7]|uniref:Glycosyl transferase, family 2 n=1 Tax=Arcticibacter svalbardensis MN12-7 TaxID=1150600 RepID=R9GN24_9SPHI|nr:glycosyltransferase [Arcticibacter svalbardensis]EOR93118.1 Glycosyl transferase, family 2 [Arcticibacter svalbardensis MN12-7]